MAASLPVRPIKRVSKLSSQARSTGALSLAGSVVTNTTLICFPTSVGTCCRLLAILAMWEWALIGTMSIAEKEQRDVALGLRPKIERRTGCIVRINFGFGSGGVTKPP